VVELVWLVCGYFGGLVWRVISYIEYERELSQYSTASLSINWYFNSSSLWFTFHRVLLCYSKQQQRYVNSSLIQESPAHGL
jgi:hypothetical protein